MALIDDVAVENSWLLLLSDVSIEDSIVIIAFGLAWVGLLMGAAMPGWGRGFGVDRPELRSHENKECSRGKVKLAFSVYRRESSARNRNERTSVRTTLPIMEMWRWKKKFKPMRTSTKMISCLSAIDSLLLMCSNYQGQAPSAILE